MPVPISQMWTVSTYVLGQKLRGNRHYPLVLMLEPLYRCNLSCAGCGKIQYPAHVLKSQLSVEDCMRAVDECPAPIVSIPGGEPLLHPDMPEITRRLIERGKYVYLCTNALLLEERIDEFTPDKHLSFSVHMDGLEEEHDFAVCREGVYRKAHAAIREAVRRGFRVTTNTTLFEGADPDRTARFFDEMMALGVEGMMISPGYSYEKAPDQEHFLARDRTRRFFRQVFERARQKGRSWRFNQSPLFLEFLSGAREYDCTPWGNPTYSVFGWQRPCYLQQDGYATSFRELVDGTPWERYGHESGNPKCRDCMVHSGFEASAVDEAFSSWRGLAAMARAVLFGPRNGARESAEEPVARPVRHDLPVAAPVAQGAVADATPETLRAAFEYRGNVTLELGDGSRVEGYVTNVGPSQLDLWQPGETRTRPIPSDRVRRIAFSGRDTASGRSWQTWLRDHDSPRATA